MTLRLVFFLLFSVFPSSADPTFIPPDETYPLIDRGQIPLDIPAIESLAKDLATLADRPIPSKADGLRVQAMLLALAQRLSPAQETAREVLLGLEEGSYNPVSSQEDRNEAKDRCLASTKWLLDRPKESVGQLLGQQILDVLSFVQPKHQLLRKHDSEGMAQRWQGVVASIERFGGGKLAPITPMPPVVQKPDPSMPNPQTPPGEKKEPDFKLTEFLIDTPMITTNKLLGAYPNLTSLSLVLREASNEGGKGKISFKPRLDKGDPTAEALYSQLRDFFKNQKQELPSNYNFHLGTGTAAHHKLNQSNFVAPLAMMLDSALTGRTLKSNVILFAKLESDGSLTRPAESWKLIQALRKQRPAPNTRFLVPPEMEAELEGLLVQEDAAFLLRFEVIGCRDFSEARELFYTAGEIPSGLTQASVIYRDIVEKASPRMKDLGSFLVYDSVEKRLADAVRSHSHHLSAKVLFKQASGHRPDKFSRRVFAMEYREFMSSLADTPKLTHSYNSNSGSALKAIQQSKRRKWRDFVDLGLVNRDEDEILNEGVKLIDELSSIARAYERDGFAAAEVKYADWKIRIGLFLKKLAEIAQR